MTAIASTTTPINTGAVSFASAAALSGTDLDALAAEVTRAQAEVTNATVAVTNATAEVARAQATLAETMSVLAEAKNILATVEAALAAHLANQPEHFIWEEQKNGTTRRIVNPQFTSWLAQKRTLESQVQTARAAVTAAERAVTQAEQALDAAKQRLEVAKQKLETAKAKVREAQQRVERARAELERRRRELERMRGLEPQEQAFVAAEITQLNTILQWNADAALQAAEQASAQAEELAIVEHWDNLTAAKLDEIAADNLALYNTLAAANANDSLERIDRDRLFAVTGASLGLNEQQTAWLAAINDEPWAESADAATVIEQLDRAAQIIPPGVWAQLEALPAEQQQMILQNFAGTAMAAAATPTPADDVIPWNQLVLVEEGLAIQTGMPWGYGTGPSAWAAYQSNPPGSAAQYFQLSTLLSLDNLPNSHYNLCGELAAAAAVGMDPKEFLTLFSTLTVPNGPAILTNPGMGTTAENLIAAIEAAGWQTQGVNHAGDPFRWIDGGSWAPSVDMLRQLLEPEGGSVLALVRLNPTTGQIDPSGGVSHWVVVQEVVTMAGGQDAVVIYNPFQNTQAVYSFDHFVQSWTPPNGNYRAVVVAPADADMPQPTNPDYVPPPTPEATQPINPNLPQAQ